MHSTKPVKEPTNEKKSYFAKLGLALASLKYSTEGIHAFNLSNDGNRSFFKYFILFGDLTYKSSRIWYTSAVLFYSLLIPIFLRTERGAGLLNHCIKNTSTKAIIKKCNTTEKLGEAAADSYSLSYSIYIGILEIYKAFRGAPPKEFSEWYIPLCFLIFPFFYLSWKFVNRNNQTLVGNSQQKSTLENRYAFHIAFKDTGSLANFFLKMLIVTKQNSFSLTNMIASPMLLLFFIFRFYLEKNYINTINKQSIIPSAITENPEKVEKLYEASSWRNVLVRAFILNLVAGWFCTATLESLAAVIIEALNGEANSHVEKTNISPLVFFPLLAIGVAYFGYALKGAKTPPSYQAHEHEKYSSTFVSY